MLCRALSCLKFLGGRALFSILGRLGTALGRLWDGSKNAESSMIARLGTVGRLGRGVYGYAQDLNPSLSPTFRTVPEAERQMLTLLTMLRLMLTSRLLENPNVYAGC